MKAYIVRVLEVEEIHGFFYYTQEDTGDRHGPFVDVPELLVHLHRGILQEILFQLRTGHH